MCSALIAFVFAVCSADVAVDPNHYEVWASARLEGGKFFIDRLAFRRVTPGD